MERSRLLDYQEALRKKIGVIQEELKKIDSLDDKEIYEKIKGTIRKSGGYLRNGFLSGAVDYYFVPDREEVPHHVMKLGVNINHISVSYDKYYGDVLIKLDIITETEMRKNLDRLLEELLKRFFE